MAAKWCKNRKSADVEPASISFASFAPFLRLHLSCSYQMYSTWTQNLLVSVKSPSVE